VGVMTEVAIDHN